jgi:hypothetical protein
VDVRRWRDDGTRECATTSATHQPPSGVRNVRSCPFQPGRRCGECRAGPSPRDLTPWRHLHVLMLIAFMRTTIDMPPALMRAAKARAAEHGESLKDLVNRAVAHEVGLPAITKGKTGRVTLPLIARDAAPTVLVTNEDIADAFDAEDAERYSAE